MTTNKRHGTEFFLRTE